MIPVIYSYARVSKTDYENRNLDTQLREMAAHGIRQGLIFADTASGRTMDRNGWKNLMARVQPEDTVVVAIQSDLTKRDIAIVALQEQIDTREDSTAAKFFWRAMLAQGPGKSSRPASASGWAWRGCVPAAHGLADPGADPGAGGPVPAHGPGGSRDPADRPGTTVLAGDRSK